MEIAYNHMTDPYDVLLLSFPQVSFCFPRQTPQLTHDQVEFDHPYDILHLQHQLDPYIEQTQNHVAPYTIKIMWCQRHHMHGAIYKQSYIPKVGLIADIHKYDPESKLS